MLHGLLLLCTFLYTNRKVCDIPNDVYLESVVSIDPKIDLVGWWIKVMSFNLGESEFFEKINAQ